MINEQALKDRIKKIAIEKGIHFNSCWKKFLLERFLARLAASGYFDKFIFKGGFLLAYMIPIGRETIDLDFLFTRSKAGKEELRKIFEEITSVHPEDGFNFSFHSIELLSQPHMEYPGYRIVLNTSFAKIKDKIQIDVGVGDIVQPLTYEIQLIQYCGKPLFEDAISLLIYPVETIFSEKLETIISKGLGNSRMKDYHDLILLLRKKELLDLDKLKVALTNTFFHRGTPIGLIQFDGTSLNFMQKMWVAHLQGLGEVAKDLDLPQDISSVIEEINKYIAPIASFS